MRFPQTFIDDLRRQADIVRVIQDYVSLKKKGANWMACCPFHQEKTPSFSVNPSKDIYYCFGCAKGGSVFNFVMEIERVSFPEAVRIVAEKANVPLPAMVEDKKFEERKKESDEVIELNSWALAWWEAQLGENNKEARAAARVSGGARDHGRDAQGVPPGLRAGQLGRALVAPEAAWGDPCADREERPRRQEGRGRVLRPLPRTPDLPRDGRAGARSRFRRPHARSPW